MHPSTHPDSRTIVQAKNPIIASDGVDYIDDAIVLSAQGAQGQRLDKWLAAQLPQFSRSRLQSWIALGAVGTDDMAVSQKYKLKGQERIVVLPQALEAQQSFVAEEVPLDVIFEDEALLVVDKPAGMVVHPAPGNWSGTLMNGLLHRGAGYFELPRAGIVHRLDKDTSGLMVVAKTESCRQALIAMIAKREVSRRYFALLHKTAPAAFSVDAAIGRDPQHRQRMAAFTAPSAHAKSALTDFRRLSLIARDEAIGPASAVECRLHSGRTHQIRVHAAHCALPLLGDSLYGGPRWPGLERQALHAWRLGFDHPLASKNEVRRMDFRSTLPHDLA
jgi:23S rRNA pseudouridine1911/1915/1917 synthase